MSNNELILNETFEHATLDPRLEWYCPPPMWRIHRSKLVVEPATRSDYWQKTHYGFTNDNGHFLYLPVAGNFVLSTRVQFFPAHQYDQAGLMVRFSSDCWLKTSVEYEGEEEPARLGAVVTNLGYSDWSTQNISRQVNEIELRIRKTGRDCLVYFRDVAGESELIQIRMAHLHLPDDARLMCGLYACSPIDAGYRAEFAYLRLEKVD